MTLTEGETKALLAATVLVVLAALGHLLLTPPAPDVAGGGLGRVTEVEAALAVAESIRAEEAVRRRPLAAGERIDPNTASEVQLDRLPGVGPSLAQAIVTHRQSEGRFWRLRDLERVPGLGSTTITRLAPFTALPQAGRPTASGRSALGSSPAGPPRPGRVDLNRASLEELEALPGIGPARAGAIVRWRGEHGSFRSVDGLLEVPGIGPATLERLRALVRVGP